MKHTLGSNSRPPLLRWWLWPNPPIHARWLGGHKTWVGVGFAVIAPSLVCFVHALSAWVTFSWADALFVLGLTWAGSELVNRLAFRWGIKVVPW